VPEGPVCVGVHDASVTQFCVMRHCVRLVPELSAAQDDVADQPVQVEPELLEVLCSREPTIHSSRFDPEESSVQVETAVQLSHVDPLFVECLV